MDQPETQDNQEYRPHESEGGEQPESTTSGGLGARLNEVDLESAQDVGSDPPGSLATDIGGGTGDLGSDSAAPVNERQ